MYETTSETMLCVGQTYMPCMRDTHNTWGASPPPQNARTRVQERVGNDGSGTGYGCVDEGAVRTQLKTLPIKTHHSCLSTLIPQKIHRLVQPTLTNMNQKQPASTVVHRPISISTKHYQQRKHQRTSNTIDRHSPACTPETNINQHQTPSTHIN